MTASGRTQKEALERIRERVDLELDQAPTVESMTVRQRCRRWLVEKRPDVSRRTLVGYERLFELYVYPVMGNARLADVTTAHVHAMLVDLRARDLRPTADHVRRVLKQMFSHSVRDGYLTVSPKAELRGERKPRRARLDARLSAKDRLEIWTPKEVQAFLDGLEGRRSREMLIVALFTGLRRGEMVALRWEDLNDDRTALRVQRAFDPFEPGKIGPPKTIESVRTVPLGTEAQDAVEIARQRYAYEREVGKIRDEGWMFPSRTGKLVDPRNFYGYFRRAIKAINAEADRLEATGVEAQRVRPIRLHGLRHTYASYLARSGQPPAMIQRLLGHASPDLALRVYTHVMDDDVTHAALNLADIVGTGLDDAKP